MKKRWSRRSFVKAAGSAGIGLGLAGRAAAMSKRDKTAKVEPDTKNFNPNMTYREVGTTGIKVSNFSIGTGRCQEELLTKSFDLGINLFHTSAKYMGGKSIEIVGKAIAGKQDRINIALKDNFDDIETVFKTLGVESVEFLMFNRHNPDKLREELPKIKEKFMTWRDKGLVKHAGLTCHKFMPECTDVAIEAGFFCCVMPTFGPKQFEGMQKQRESLRAKKMSIIGMKTKGELDAEAYPGQIRTVLSEPAMATVCKGVKSVEDMEAWAAAAGAVKTGFWIRRENHGLAAIVPGCIMCGECEKACPNGVATADIVRCRRYYLRAEHEPEMARAEFKELDGPSSASKCKMCGQCEIVCPQDIAVREELRGAWKEWVWA